MAHHLKARIDRLAARLPRVEPEALGDPLDDPEFMAVVEALGGPAGLRSCAAYDPGLLEVLAPTIEALERGEQEGRPWHRT